LEHESATHQTTQIKMRSCQSKLSQTEHTLSLSRDELSRVKQALSTKERNFVQEGRRRDREMDKLRDQLTMSLKDSVIARHEIKDRIVVPREGMRTHDDRFDVLVSENEQLRQLLVQVRKSLMGMSQEAGVDIPDEQALLTEPIEWNMALFKKGSDQLLTSLSEFVEQVRETAAQCRDFVPHLDAAREIARLKAELREREGIILERDLMLAKSRRDSQSATVICDTFIIVMCSLRRHWGWARRGGGRGRRRMRGLRMKHSDMHESCLVDSVFTFPASI
jgi:competence CoiA-like predicted nuclease